MGRLGKMDWGFSLSDLGEFQSRRVLLSRSLLRSNVHSFLDANPFYAL